MNGEYIVPLQVELPAKRKRGRPRKDVTNPSMQPHQIPLAPEITMQGQQVESTHLRANIGGTVSGVVDGIFDAGYLITVRIGNNSTPLRGIAFQPGRYLPVTPANDIAPQARTYQRREVQNQGNGIVSEEVVKPASIAQENQELVSVIQSHSSPPLQNLRMVEQDEVMQVFEVSTYSAENTKIDAKDANNEIDQGANRTEPDPFLQEELKMPFMELLQSSMGTNPEEVALDLKNDRIENLHENIVNSQAQHKTIESEFQQPSALPNDLHQTTPVPQCVQQEHHQQELKTSEHQCPQTFESQQSIHPVDSEVQENKLQVQNGLTNSRTELQHQTTPLPECAQQDHQHQEPKTSENAENVGLHQCPQVLENHQEPIHPVDTELQANKSQEQNGLTNSKIELQHQTSPLPECVQQELHHQEQKTSENADNGVHQCPPVLESPQQSVLPMNSELHANELLKENGVTNSIIEQKQQSNMFNGSQLIEHIQEKPHSLENDPSNLQAAPLSAEDTSCKLEAAVKDYALI